MIVLAFRLVWAFARLLLLLSWMAGQLIGYAIITIARTAAHKRALDAARRSPERGGQ